MKGKATVTATAPQALRDYLSSTQFRETFLREVVENALRVEGARGRPAEHFVQAADEMIPGTDGKFGLVLVLSGASVRDGRYFGGALKAMQSVAEEAIRRCVPEATGVQMFCQIATDVPVPGERSTLLESEAVWIKGAAALAAT